MKITKTIVVSAVNINIGGTLTILRDCLAYLSSVAKMQDLRVIAIVYDKNLAYYPDIEYIEIRWAKKTWVNRLWCEYVFMRNISRQLAPVYLWLSLHDTTPSVMAQRRAVYCHNSFPFYKWKVKDLFLDYKIVLFALFSKYIYRPNIHRNSFVIVQQDWFKREFVRMFHLDSNKIIVASPAKLQQLKYSDDQLDNNSIYKFFFPSSPGIHKNYELLCQAAKNIERKGIGNFEVILTIDGKKNKYDKIIVKKHKGVRSLKFVGFLSQKEMFAYYARVNCLVFPSKMESWGLPISEFSATGKPMLLSDLPYAHSAAANSKKTAFFNPEQVDELQKQMECLLRGEENFLKFVPEEKDEGYHTRNWDELFAVIMGFTLREEGNYSQR